MRRLLIAVVLLLSAAAAHAQAPSAFPYSKPMQNDPTTGTTQWTLTKQNASGNAVIMATTDVNGYAGVCVANCGKVGTAWVAFAGLVPVTVDGTATINHYLLISTTTGGDGHDNGATSYPYTVVVGRVNAGATTGNQAMVDLFPPEIRPASGPVVFGTGAGTAQAQTLTTTIGPVATALTTGWTYCWVPSNANSGAAPTLAADGLTATTITKTPNHTALVANDLLTSRVACAIYDGANMELQNPQTAVSSVGTLYSVGAAQSTIATASPQFFPINGANSGGAGEGNVASVIGGTGCTAKNAYVVTSNTNGAAALTITLRNAATLAGMANTAIVVTVGSGAAAGTFNDTTHTVSISAGTVLSWNATMGGAGLTSAQIVGIGFQCN